MKKLIAYASVLSASLLVGNGAFAAGGTCNVSTGIAQKNFKCLVGFATDAINEIVVVLIGVGLIVFLWGLVKYIAAGGDEKQVDEAKRFIVFGLLAFTVMMSVWGLVNILIGIFFPSGALLIPQVK